MWPTLRPLVSEWEYFKFSEAIIELLLWSSQSAAGDRLLQKVWSWSSLLFWTCISSVLSHSTRIDELDALLMNAPAWLNSSATSGVRGRAGLSICTWRMSHGGVQTGLPAIWMSFFHYGLELKHSSQLSIAAVNSLGLPEVVVNRLFRLLWKMCASLTEWCRRSQPT